MTSVFSFTKLVVSDLARSERFYCGVFGMRPIERVRSEEHAYGLEETILSSEGEASGHVLIVMRYLHRPHPLPGAAWLGFVVEDLDKTTEAALQHGGTIAVPSHENEQHGVRTVILADQDGHLIEVVQPTNLSRELEPIQSET